MTRLIFALAILLLSGAAHACCTGEHAGSGISYERDDPNYHRLLVAYIVGDNGKMIPAAQFMALGDQPKGLSQAYVRDINTGHVMVLLVAPKQLEMDAQSNVYLKSEAAQALDFPGS